MCRCLDRRTAYRDALSVRHDRGRDARRSGTDAGRRRDRLHDYINRDLLPAFLGRVIPFDLACTAAYAEVLAAVKLAGSGIETADALIAAVARANGLVVATRDTNPFQFAGLAVINPWET